MTLNWRTTKELRSKLTMLEAAAIFQFDTRSKRGWADLCSPFMDSTSDKHDVPGASKASPTIIMRKQFKAFLQEAMFSYSNYSMPSSWFH